MPQTNCEKLKKDLKDIKVGTWKKFLDKFENEERLDDSFRDIMGSTSRAINLLKKDLNITWVNTPNGKKFKMPKREIGLGPVSHEKIWANMRRSKKLETGMVVSIGDVVEAKFIYKGIVWRQKCTIEGFELGNDEIIISFIEEKPLVKLLKNKGYSIAQEVYKKVS